MPSTSPAFRLVMRGLQGLALLALVATLAPARADRADRAAPRPNYRQALKYSAANLDPLTYSTSVSPGWIGKTDSFWYSYKTGKGTAFWLVDPANRTKKALFDREKLASQLAEVSRRPVDANQLALTRTRISDDGGKFAFVFAEMLYDYDLKAEKLTSKGKAPAQPRGPGGGFRGFGRRRVADAADEDEPQVKDKGKGKEKVNDKDKVDRTRRPPVDGGRQRPTRVVSPDRKAVLFTKDNNLFLADVDKEKEAAQLTKDGGEDYSFMLAGGFGQGRMRRGGGMQPPASPWSKDGKFFYATRSDGRGVKELFVIDSLASPRPTLEKYKYPMPGEDTIRKTELHVGSRAAKTLARVTPKWKDESYNGLEWEKEPGQLRFVRQDRLCRNLELCVMDAATGHCRVLISEGFENAPVVFQPPRHLEGSSEMIWWSERSGWGHYYLYERNGKLKNAITSGPWRASRIIAVDEKERRLFFVGNAREKGENVYYEHLYSVKLDGTGLRLLNPGDAHHVAGLGRGMPMPFLPDNFSMLSPSRKYLVDNTSRVDQGPDSVLRDAFGNLVMELEKADLSRLHEHGWRPAETFTVKAADGVTDLYGNLWKPFDFDPTKKYPIIANVYPGPQTEGVTHTFSAYSANMQLAQLGFIVIQVGHRGGSPTRSKAYASYGYFNLRDYGLADKKTAIEQLAARHPWIDLKKVGIFGHSGGGFMSAAAMLQKPYNEFFTAAVASAGNHDNNIYGHTWAERYHGMKEVPIKEEAKDKTKRPTQWEHLPERPAHPQPAAPPAATKKAATPPVKKAAPAAPPRTKFEIKVPTNAELAANLKGRLLLVHGEIDNNVHPANTMRLVDALIKANKRFDMLIIPGKRHGFGDANGYFTRRMWEFFAEHLLGDHRAGGDMADEKE
jgi:dipeptidyl aminopeptidase/acylaminoacyl peptidase